ncbi:Zn-ribbon domain-containing OB-fold protein [Mycobacterium sp. CVI_P3]|uniref:Zn-ribbon domain-containing OB-fold protein n=1 Tax=Mycobacterium pinniadriaticum TaxID=2994102 RepID=A0ABT3SM19_9MYCO|nr:Zn-ribbon domain-containing OB-fold protein [Mycobacterium pinniadriaticum]MCX2934012.1 Zn-ribbon domain-containing OB-fold protein [Mycobacterium pinniadriaticum]MCX2940392.1 Zn-ribbon domain-containing OB-fold protein [Mycobacterium pinniadriaticum]
MSTPQLPSPAPSVNPETATFWAATLAGKLVLQRCSNCDRAGYYPRYVCANCHSTDLVDTEASGRGTIYSYTVTTRGILEYANAGSYVLAMVELDEGPKMVTNIIDCDPDALSIGQRVEVVFCDTGGEGALPRFRPAGPGM